MIFYAADDDHGGAMLCGTVSGAGRAAQSPLWRRTSPLSDLRHPCRWEGFQPVSPPAGQGEAAGGSCVRRHATISTLPPLSPRTRSRWTRADYYDRLAAQIRQLAAAVPRPRPGAVRYPTSPCRRSRERLQAAALPFRRIYDGQRPARHPGGISRRSRQYPAGHRRGVGGRWTSPATSVSPLIIRHASTACRTL